MKCKQCGNEFEAQRSTAQYCSANCRKLAFQENGKVSVPGVSVPIPEFITDAAGAQHKIDYEGRRKDYALLKSWVVGKGTESQQQLGLLAQDYDALKGVDIQRYLGYQSKATAKLPESIKIIIDRLAAWFEQKNIQDDKAERIQRAIHYHNNVAPSRLTSSSQPV